MSDAKSSDAGQSKELNDQHFNEEDHRAKLKEYREKDKQNAEASRLQNNGQKPLDQETFNKVVSEFIMIYEKRRQQNVDRILAEQFSLGNKVPTSNNGSGESNLERAQRDWMNYGPKTVDPITVNMQQDQGGSSSWHRDTSSVTLDNLKTLTELLPFIPSEHHKAIIDADRRVSFQKSRVRKHEKAAVAQDPCKRRLGMGGLTMREVLS